MNGEVEDLPLSGEFSASVSWASTAQGSCVDEVGLTLDVESYILSTSELADQLDHSLDGDGLGPARETNELEGFFSCSTGGVVDRGGGAKYDRLLISQNEANSGPSSIAPLSLIPYLNIVSFRTTQNKRVTHLVATSLSLSLIRCCPCTATVQVSKERE